MMNANQRHTYTLNLPALMAHGWVDVPDLPGKGFSFTSRRPLPLVLANMLIAEHDNGLDLAKVYLGEIQGPAWMQDLNWSK